MIIQAEREKGPIEILCKEIGFNFDPRLERTELLVAFVGVLVTHISEQRWMIAAIAEKVPTCNPPTSDSLWVLQRVEEMLANNDYDSLIEKAASIHDLIYEVAPDDMVPCDHLIDMLSSCVGAIRFGLEKPCHSRHAAAAAGHICEQLYLKRSDRYTSVWVADWTRQQLQAAIISRLDFAATGQPKEGET